MQKRFSIIFTICLCLQFFVNTLYADQVKSPKISVDKASVSSRIDNVRNLVHSSSGSKRVEKGDSEAKQFKADANAHLERAEQLFKSGDMEGANNALHESTMSMFKAIRKVGLGKPGTDKLLQDYRDRRNSLNALVDALERVAKEKKTSPVGLSEIGNKAINADKLAESGDIKQARILLDEAYESVKLEVEMLRSGDTLVRTLEFASEEEEYIYELDRNDTHQMLVTLLLEDKKIDATVQEQVDAYLAEADVFRTKALTESDAGHYGKGIQLLEESTKQLVKAIRRAGVYIPG